MNPILSSISAKSLRKPLLIALSISLVLLLLICAFATPAIAWFKRFTVEENPAQLTNFITTVEYTINNGASWMKVNAGDPISVGYESVADLKIRVGYQGIHQAYLRMKVYGDYVNRHTGTHLPNPDDTELFTLTSTSTSTTVNWKKDAADGYFYFSKKQGASDGNLVLLPPVKIDSDLSGLDASDFQEYNTELYVIVDAVQPDRIQEIWGIDTIPS